MNRPQIHVIATGGTIAMTGDSGRNVIPDLEASSQVARIPELQDIADVTTETFFKTPGSHLLIGDIVRLAARIAELTDTGIDGIVVTQGTDTIEEAAFALEVLGPEQAPVVVTGAMRSPDRPGADGAANMLNAVRIAASEAARGMGVLVTFDDTIHASRFVRKVHSSRPSAFESPSAGPVGWIAEDRVRIVLRTHPGPRLEPRDIALPIPHVALLRISLGDDGRLIPTLRERGYAGAVIEALGVGHVGHWLLEPLEALTKEMPVVFASRTGAGEVFQGTYGFEGSEQDLLDLGLVPSGMLDGLKARIFLSLGIAGDWERHRLHEAMGGYVC